MAIRVERKKIKKTLRLGKRYKKVEKAPRRRKKVEKGEHGESNNIEQQGTMYNNKKKHVIGHEFFLSGVRECRSLGV